MLNKVLLKVFLVITTFPFTESSCLRCLRILVNFSKVAEWLGF